MMYVYCARVHCALRVKYDRCYNAPMAQCRRMYSMHIIYCGAHNNTCFHGIVWLAHTDPSGSEHKHMPIDYRCRRDEDVQAAAWLHDCMLHAHR